MATEVFERSGIKGHSRDRWDVSVLEEMQWCVLQAAAR